MLVLLALALVGAVPVELTLTEAVDFAEVNHFYDDVGRHVFDQVIFSDWNAELGCEEVRAWRLVKNPHLVPRRDWAGGGYRATFWDGERLRDIRLRAVRESWTQYDPELEARNQLPKERRKGLLHDGQKPR